VCDNGFGLAATLFIAKLAIREEGECGNCSPIRYLPATEGERLSKPSR
jgi:hypothetical protein